ncbi:retrovirus-related pol polyprotein from transposon TNT 1-94 [Tanacetum coccineum]
MGTVSFRNDHFVAITGYGDYVQGNLTICHVYYVQASNLEEEYYSSSSSEVSDNFAANTLDKENTLSSSSIVVEEDEAPQIVSSLTEQDLQICTDFTKYITLVDMTKIQPIKQVIGDTLKPVMTKRQLHTDAEFKRLDVWELVECHIGRNIIAVNSIWKNKTDAENKVIQNKSCLVAKGYGQEEGIDFEESFAPVARL